MGGAGSGSILFMDRWNLHEGAPLSNRLQGESPLTPAIPSLDLRGPSPLLSPKQRVFFEMGVRDRQVSRRTLR